MTENTPSLSTAYHEAGHAVLALWQGRPVHKVTIEADARRLGRCELRKGLIRPNPDLLEAEMLIVLGGIAAETKLTGRFDVEGASQDLRTLHFLATQRAATPRQVARLERRMLDKAEYLMNQPGVWAAVERIAQELMQLTTISGRAARHLFEVCQAHAAQ